MQFFLHKLWSMFAQTITVNVSRDTIHKYGSSEDNPFSLSLNKEMNKRHKMTRFLRPMTSTLNYKIKKKCLLRYSQFFFLFRIHFQIKKNLLFDKFFFSLLLFEILKCIIMIKII
jgi:hypothetical protein